MPQTVKSNPYVYPFIPFEDLSNKEIKNNFVGKKELDWEDLSKMVRKIKSPKPEIGGTTTAEKILSVFLDDEYRFGPREFIEENRENWINKLNLFIEKNQPLKLTILGFPFKVPVPLKTNRHFPDMGDVLALLRLFTINNIIKEIYSPGAKTVIFTEGVFGRFSGVSTETASQYRDFLQEIIERLGFSTSLEISDLAEMESTVNDFPQRYEEKISQLKNLYLSGDPNFLEKYKGTYESIYRIISTEGSDDKFLMDVYNENLSDDDAPAEVLEFRKKLRSETHETVFKYHAYLLVRDDLDYIQKKSPNSIPLSVSPKPNRLGVIAVHQDCLLLPHHGVTVFYPDRGMFLIEYLIDIKRRNCSFTPVFLRGDKDNKPFYYEVKS